MLGPSVHSGNVNRAVSSPKRRTARVFIVLLTMLISAWSTACSNAAEPAEVVTFESIEGFYELYSVGGKRTPVTTGICFLGGCFAETITGGSLELSSALPGRWKIQLNTADPQVPTSTSTRTYIGFDATVNADGSILLVDEERSECECDRWKGSIRRDEVTLIHDIRSYTFRRVRG